MVLAHVLVPARPRRGCVKFFVLAAIQMWAWSRYSCELNEGILA